METIYQVLGIVAAIALIWLLYNTIKNRPDQFSKEKMNQSFGTMGLLALVLIVFVALLIAFVRSS